MGRCFDCFADLPDGSPRFAVLKKMREIDIPPDASEPPSFFQTAAFDDVIVCAECAGWYRDAIPVEAA